MAYKYHTQLLSSFFDRFIELLSKAGTNKIEIYNSSGGVLAKCTFPNSDFVANKTDSTLQLIASDNVLAELDGTATKGAIFNGEGVKLVEFDVGSQTVNQSAELILNSVIFYKGGTVTVNNITLTV